MKLFNLATEITGAEWPELKQITSPCPTLKVIGAVTQGMVKREELKRVRTSDREGMDGSTASTKKPKLSTTKKAVSVADRVVSGVLSNTVGRVARLAGRRVLGEIPETAKTGSYHELKSDEESDTNIEEKNLDGLVAVEGDAVELIDEEIMSQIKKENTETPNVDTEDEALFRELAEKQSSNVEVP